MENREMRGYRDRNPPGSTDDRTAASQQHNLRAPDLLEIIDQTAAGIVMLAWVCWTFVDCQGRHSLFWYGARGP